MDYQEEPSQLAGYPPPYHHHPHPQPSFHFYPPQPQQNPTINPNPNPNPNPSFDYQHHSSLHGLVSVPPPVEQSYPVSYGGDYNGGLPSYYHDPNWTANGGFEAYSGNPVVFPNSSGNALPPNIAPQFVATNYNHNLGTPQKSRHQIMSSSRKISKKTKIPQSVRCDVCKILCDTEEVLKKHRLGKKHKQNLEKLKAVVAGQDSSPAIISATLTPEAPDMSTPLNGQTKKKKKASEKADDMETKKKRVLEGGAAMDAVRTCSICKVVCNSETVFQYHLAGQKHAAMVKKQASGIAGQTAMAPAP